MTTLATSAGRTIRRFRQACGLSLPELGELAGIPGWRIGQIERREGPPASESELFSLAVALSVFARVLACSEIAELAEEATARRGSTLATPQLVNVGGKRL